MKSCVYKKYGIKIVHIWFEDESNYRLYQGQGDIIYLHGVVNKLKLGIAKEQNSLMTDLTMDEESLFRNINKNYKYEIRRCGKENVVYRTYVGYEIYDVPGLLENFKVTYNEMYKAKGMNVEFNTDLVKTYIKNGMITFSIAFYNNQPLVFHSYICDKENVRFFYSASSFRTNTELAKVIGRMNKGLHWYDLKYFKSEGYRYYDWGGISDLKQPNGIDQFKIRFGGEPCSYYNIIYGSSIIGKLLVFCLKVKLYFTGKIGESKDATGE